jgi:AcrR family transcriptional regulator
MGRKADLARKPDLLCRVIDYLCANGIGDLSLRPLARALDVSTYALVYHFGSKEGVLVAALGEVERRQRAMIATWRDAPEPPRTAELFERYWNWCSAEANLPTMRLVIEATMLEATRSGLPASLRAQLVSDWVDLLASGLRADGRSPAVARMEATLANAALLGLVLDLIATGDRRRTGRALRRMVEALAAPE